MGFCMGMKYKHPPRWFLKKHEHLGYVVLKYSEAI